MCSRCVLMLASLMNSFVAASRLVAPSATSLRTCSSRWLSTPCAGSRTLPIRRPATVGASTASPLAAARLDAVDPGHAQVHEHDVRAQRDGPGHGLGPVAGVPHDLELGGAGERAP